jgi:hypothetical protein
MTDFHRTSVDSGASFEAQLAFSWLRTSTPARSKISDVIYLASGAGSALYDPLAFRRVGWLDRSRCDQDRHPDHPQQRRGVLRRRSGHGRHLVGPDQLGVQRRNPARRDDAGEAPARVGGFGDHARQRPDDPGAGDRLRPAASYTQRRLAILFQRPNGRIRAYLFHKVQRMPQESSVTHAKTGEQISIPVRFRVLADSLDQDPYKRFFIIRDQSTPANTGG